MFQNLVYNFFFNYAINHTFLLEIGDTYFQVRTKRIFLYRCVAKDISISEYYYKYNLIKAFVRHYT